jgi:predicted nuclease of restriction endonuclease-like (RecB) superfamily
MTSKKKQGDTPKAPTTPQDGFTPLLDSLRQLIADSRQQVLRAVDVVQVQTYWHIGRHIVEFEQGGAQRAAYGQRLLQQLGQALSAEFGRGFEERNLRNMRAFYLIFPNWNALRSELSWTHYRLLLRVDSAEARQWYVEEAAAQNWSTRALERQIGSLYFERLLLSQDKTDKDAVTAEARTNLNALEQSPRAFVRDPVMLEFLGLPDTGRLLEAKLETALMDKLQQFLMELGKGFAFVARQQRISTETQDFYVDLVFYNYLLKCFVLIDLKTGSLTHQDVGQMDMYVRMYDDLRRGDGDNPTVGILLCGSKDKSVVRYSVLNGNEQLFASKYRLVLPSEDELRLEMQRDREEIEAQKSIGNGGDEA